MNPYEPEKVSKANELYSEVLHTDEQADKQLKQLRLRAIEELGIKFSTEKLFGKLSAACNPKNFTGESYNKERLELANRLYQAVMMNADNVLALEEIEGEAPSYKHAFSRWMYSGFRIKIFTGRLLSKDEMIFIGNTILSNEQLVRRLVVLGWDTLEIHGENATYGCKWKLSDHMETINLLYS